MQYSDIHILGKKVGVSLLALNLLSFQKHKRYSKIVIWQFLLSVIVGSICAIMGILFPPPAHFARRDIQARLMYYGKVLPTLMQQQVDAWLLEPQKGVIVDRLWHKGKPLNEGVMLSFSGAASTIRLFSSVPRLSKWRKVLIVLKAINAFKHSGRSHIGWLDSQFSGIKNVYVRQEMLSFLSVQLEELERRMEEASFEFASYSTPVEHCNYFKASLSMLASIIALMKEFERQIASTGNQPKYFYIYSAFFACPEFRRGVHGLCREASRTLTLVLTSFQERQQDQLFEQLAAAIDRMRTATAEFDAIYLNTRKRLYYGLSVETTTPRRLSCSETLLPIEAEVTFTLNTSLFLLDTSLDYLAICCADLELAKRSTQTSLPMCLRRYAASLYLTFSPCHRGVRCLTTKASAMKTRLRAALLVSSTMLLAGGSTSGVNIVTCVNRSIGTVLACVYVIIIAYIVSFTHSSVVNGRISGAAYSLDALILGVASVLFQVPCTYIRTYPLYSYAGTVAGFTAALLLINPRLTVNHAVDRIVDTFVGVVIYIAMELILFAQSSEVTLLADMSCFLKGINKQFAVFIQHATTVSETEQQLSGTDSGLEKLHALLRRQRDLLPFYKSEPTVFRSPPFPDRLLLEVMREEEELLISLTLMHRVVWKIKALSATTSAAYRDGSSSLSGFDISQESDNVDNDDDELTAETDDIVTASCQQVHSAIESSFDGILLSRLSFNRQDTECTLPHFEPILLPLQSHFKRLDVLVESSVAYLVGCLSDLQRENIQSSYKNTYSGGERGPFHALCLLNHDRCTSIFERTTKAFSAEGIADADSARYQSYYCGELRGEAMDTLCHDFQEIINQLQAAVANHASIRQLQQLSREEIKLEGSPKIVSNQEIILVSTLLGSTQRIMHAIKHLACAIGKLQAFRDVVITQNAFA
eukprot:gene28850-34820_t